MPDFNLMATHSSAGLRAWEWFLIFFFLLNTNLFIICK